MRNIYEERKPCEEKVRSHTQPANRLKVLSGDC